MISSPAGRWFFRERQFTSIWGFPACLWALIIAAQARARERQRLAALSDAALKDVGLTRADIERELQKPVWRR